MYWGWVGGGVCGGHDYRRCFVIGNSRLNFSRSRLPATLNLRNEV